MYFDLGLKEITFPQNSCFEINEVENQNKLLLLLDTKITLLTKISQRNSMLTSLLLSLAAMLYRLLVNKNH